MSTFFHFPFGFRSALRLLPSPDQERRQSLKLQLFTRAAKAARADVQILQEFRAKMRQAEELISKLTFNLREIQDSWRKPKYTESPRVLDLPTEILRLPEKLDLLGASEERGKHR